MIAFWLEADGALMESRIFIVFLNIVLKSVLFFMALVKFIYSYNCVIGWKITKLKGVEQRLWSYCSAILLEQKIQSSI
jgi:hypothetical protein